MDVVYSRIIVDTIVQSLDEWHNVSLQSFHFENPFVPDGTNLIERRCWPETQGRKQPTLCEAVAK